MKTIPLALALILASGGSAQTAAELRARGVGLLQQNLVQEAIAQLRAAAELDPDDPATRFQLGRALFAAGRLELAAEQLRLALPHSADPAAVHYQLGLVLLSGDRLEDAWLEFGTAARLRPELKPAAFQQAEICYRVGAVAEARRRLQALAATTPRWAGPAVRAAELALEEGDSAAAARWFGKALEIAPAREGLWIRQGDALAAAFDNAGAEAAYEQAIRLAPDSVTARVALGYHLFNTQAFQRAVENLREALERAPGDPSVQLPYAEALLYLGRAREALGVLEQAAAALALGTDSAAARGDGVATRGLRAGVLELQAKILLELGRLDDAEAVARRLLAGDRRSIQGSFTLGMVMQRRGDPGAAAVLGAFKRLSDAREHRELGDEYLRLAGDAVNAEREYRVALRVDPEDVDARVGLGRALLAGGDAAAALRSLEQAHTAGADGREWRRAWVLSLHAVGRDDDARVAWTAARAIGLTLGPKVWAALRQEPTACPTR